MLTFTHTSDLVFKLISLIACALMLAGIADMFQDTIAIGHESAASWLRLHHFSPDWAYMLYVVPGLVCLVGCIFVVRVTILPPFIPTKLYVLRVSRLWLIDDEAEQMTFLFNGSLGTWYRPLRFEKGVACRSGEPRSIHSPTKLQRSKVWLSRFPQAMFRLEGRSRWRGFRSPAPP